MANSFFIILACFLWASDGLIRYPLLGQGYSPLHIVFVEQCVLSLIFVPFLKKLILKLRQTSFISIVCFIVIGSFGSALSTLAFTKAFTQINPSIVILLQKFQPIVAVSFAFFFLKEKVNREFIFWCAVCMLGVFLMSYDDLFSEGFSFLTNLNVKEKLSGYILAFVAIFGWGASTVFGKKLSLLKFKELEILCGRFYFALLTLCPLMLFDMKIPQVGAF